MKFACGHKWLGVAQRHSGQHAKLQRLLGGGDNVFPLFPIAHDDRAAVEVLALGQLEMIAEGCDRKTLTDLARGFRHSA